MRLINQIFENSNWGEVEVLFQEEKVQFPYHIPTGEVFNHDPELLIRFKCIVLTGLTLLVTVMRSIYWLAQSIFLIITETFRFLDNQDPISENREAIISLAVDSLRAWKYGALMIGCALKGIFFPYAARQAYGQLERELNKHADGPHRDKFYLAFCFQRLTILKKDGKNDEVISQLTKYLARVKRIQEALWSCSLQKLMVELKIR